MTLFKKIMRKWHIIILAAFVIFLGVSGLAGYDKGLQCGDSFADIIFSMLTIVPCAFILIALFEVWIKRETVIKQLGHNSGIKGYFWAMLLGGMTVGGMYVAFPLAYTLFRKGARLQVVFCFLGFAGLCRIPMTVFEAAFMGWRFTALRLGVGTIILLIAGILLGGWLEKKNYQLSE